MDEDSKRQRSRPRTTSVPTKSAKEARGGRSLQLLCACGRTQTFRGANTRALDLAVRRAGWKNHQCPTCLARKENAS